MAISQQSDVPWIKVSSQYRPRNSYTRNCKRIEVPVLFSLRDSKLSNIPTPTHKFTDFVLEKSTANPGVDCRMLMQAELSPKNTSISSSPDHNLLDGQEITTDTEDTTYFHFLNLPVEVRLHIYILLLPPRIHHVATQLPYNGAYYTFDNIPNLSTQSFYIPLLERSSYNTKERYTTYYFPSANTDKSAICGSIYTDILLASKQCLREGLSILYGGEGVTIDFGSHIDAVIPFLEDRSEKARKMIKYLAVEVWLNDVDGGVEIFTTMWSAMINYIKKELTGMKQLRIIVLSDDDGKEKLAKREGTATENSLARLALLIASTERQDALELNEKSELGQENFKERDATSAFVRGVEINEGRMSWN